MIGLKEIVKAAETQQVIADGDDVCIIYDLVTNRAYFDPRPLLRS